MFWNSISLKQYICFFIHLYNLHWFLSCDIHFKGMVWKYLDGLVQKRRNSIANALELRLSCTNPSI